MRFEEKNIANFRLRPHKPACALKTIHYLTFLSPAYISPWTYDEDDEHEIMTHREMNESEDDEDDDE